MSDTRRQFLELTMRTESQLQTSLLKGLRDLGFDLIYHTFDSRRSEDGFPDLVAINRGRGILWTGELKAPKGAVKPAQLEWADGFAGLKVLMSAGIVRPATYDAALDAVAEEVLRSPRARMGGGTRFDESNFSETRIARFASDQ